MVELALSVVVGVVLLTVMVIQLMRARRREQKGAEQLRLAVAEGQTIPLSLHPVIDPALCVGSFSCIRACPEGEIIGVVDGVATLVEAAHCIGHGRCAVECPVGAIKLVFGTAEMGIDLPKADDTFESSRGGVYIIGELGGMGLIKNALRQGLVVGQVLKDKLKRSQATETVSDVVVVGGGPAGIACAVACRQHGLDVRILEQDTLGGCIAHYPRGKVVMTEKVVLPFYGKFGRALISKEQLTADLHEVLRKSGVKIEERQKVTKIEGEPGMFTVTTAGGVTCHARAVVLATGLKGSPRKLGVPGEEGAAKVTYRLTDPEEFHGRRVLIVGGGDSAVEAAVQLAEESTAKVSISYRQDSFSRCKQRNRDNIQRLIDAGRVRALFSTQVVSLEDKLVVLKTKEGEEGRLKNDHVIASLGGELPTEFLKSVGVSIKKYTGQAKGEATGAGDRRAGAPPTKAQVEATTRRRLAIALFALGSAILVGLFLMGSDYYLLSPEDRRESVAHEMMRPAGLWGHSVGIIATTFMFANFLYAVRKRFRPLKGDSTIRTWLTFHMFVGIMSPLVIAFHAAFLASNMLAIYTWIALTIVVGTGVFGRFLFGFVPAQAGKLLALADIRAELAALERKLEPHLEEATNPEVVRTLFRAAQSQEQPKSFLRMVVETPAVERRLARQLDRVAPYFLDTRTFHAFRNGVLAIVRGRMQIAFYQGLKRLFRAWLVVHVVLAVFMAILIGAHVAVTTYYGFSEWAS